MDDQLSIHHLFGDGTRLHNGKKDVVGDVLLEKLPTYVDLTLICITDLNIVAY